MKLATLTTHRADNYGAVLQAYALQRFILSSGAECEILDYIEPFFQKLYNSPWSLSKNILSRCRAYLRWRFRDKTAREKFDDFRKRLVISRQKYYSSDDLSSTDEIYDDFIVGSDQMWNPANYGLREKVPDLYFLAFAPKTKRHAYSVSIGRKELPPELESQFFRYLPEFRSISVRETLWAERIGAKSGHSVLSTLDPVFLLDADEWERDFPAIADAGDKKPYLLLYNILNSKTLKDYANQLASQRNLALITIQHPVGAYMGHRALRGVGPIDFMRLIRNAEVVIANSFHGAAFSIIFGRELHIGYEADSGKSRNSRFDALWEKCGIEIDAQMEHHFHNMKIISVPVSKIAKGHASVLKAQKQLSKDFIMRIVKSDA